MFLSQNRYARLRNMILLAAWLDHLQFVAFIILKIN